MEIPVYRADGSLYSHVELERVLENHSHFELVRNRRGHVKRAICKPTINFDVRPSSSIGESFHQAVPSGFVWALHGVTGSDSEVRFL